MNGSGSLQGELPLDGGIQSRFERFHHQNPEVYRKLVRLAQFLRRQGVRHSSIDYLWHILRWRIFLKTRRDSSFKLNDHFTSRYARLIEEQEPELRGFFTTRGLRTN